MSLSDRMALMQLQMFEIAEEIEARPGQPLEDAGEFKGEGSNDQNCYEEVKPEEVELARLEKTPRVRKSLGNSSAKGALKDNAYL
jgi:hypothetical protein